VTAAWDTTLASRIHPDAPVLRHLFDRALADDRVRLAAPAVLEVAYGYQRKAPSDARFGVLLRWFTRLVAGTTVEVVPLDARAAVIAGRLRGVAPHPPPKRRADRRSKTMRQAAWVMDIQVAATAFAAGVDVATANRADFERLGELLAELYPDAPRLAVVDPPL
jgi:predicted nucleic acid-binding protein